MGKYCDLGAIADPEIGSLSPNPTDWKVVRMALQTEILPGPTEFLHPGTTGSKFWWQRPIESLLPLWWILMCGDFISKTNQRCLIRVLL
jgi:hypothetical protein